MNFIQKFYKKLFSPTPLDMYQIIGEMKGIKSLVDKFYNVMENDLNAKDCLALHPLENGLITAKIKEKLCDFLSGWMGGENLFIQKYGHPKMRARHIKFKIGEKEKEQWLYCMNIALNSHCPKLSRKNKTIFLNSFTALAMRIQNS